MFGKQLQKKLAKHYKTIDALAQLTSLDLVTVDEIGERGGGWQSVMDFFQNQEKKDYFSFKSFGIQFEMKEDFSKVSSILEEKLLLFQVFFNCF